ncbi:MAG: hypothetical protein JW908_16545 [Anaerolineales bacterium]|nr:hypothetical protein [Anaerolineales bacterium]
MNNTPISPASMLAKVIKKKAIEGIWLISGERQVGKTTWCSSLARQAKAAGWKVGGLITPAVFSGGEKVGFDLIDLLSNVQYHFGVSDSAHPDWIKIGDWRLNPEVLAWANQQLKHCRGCELFILDELGPLEFKHNQGFHEGMKLLDDKAFHAAFVVIRPELLPLARDRWPQAGVIEIRKETNDPG